MFGVLYSWGGVSRQGSPCPGFGVAKALLSPGRRGAPSPCSSTGHVWGSRAPRPHLLLQKALGSICRLWALCCQLGFLHILHERGWQHPQQGGGRARARAAGCTSSWCAAQPRREQRGWAPHSSMLGPWRVDGSAGATESFLVTVGFGMLLFLQGENKSREGQQLPVPPPVPGAVHGAQRPRVCQPRAEHHHLILP